MDESSRRPVQVDGDGAAKRRRLRRLRSWWRHEQQTVAAVLASAHHHTATTAGARRRWWRTRAARRWITCRSTPFGDRSLHLRESGRRLLRRLPVDGGLTVTVPVLAGRAAESVDSLCLLLPPLAVTLGRAGGQGRGGVGGKSGRQGAAVGGGGREAPHADTRCPRLAR